MEIRSIQCVVKIHMLDDSSITIKFYTRQCIERISSLATNRNNALSSAVDSNFGGWYILPRFAINDKQMYKTNSRSSFVPELFGILLHFIQGPWKLLKLSRIISLYFQDFLVVLVLEFIDHLIYLDLVLAPLYLKLTEPFVRVQWSNRILRETVIVTRVWWSK